MHDDKESDHVCEKGSFFFNHVITNKLSMAHLPYTRSVSVKSVCGITAGRAPVYGLNVWIIIHTWELEQVMSLNESRQEINFTHSRHVFQLFPCSRLLFLSALSLWTRARSSAPPLTRAHFLFFFLISAHIIWCWLTALCFGQEVHSDWVFSSRDASSFVCIYSLLHRCFSSRQ